MLFCAYGRGPVTQRLECHPYKVEVGGSIPPGPTRLFNETAQDVVSCLADFFIGSNIYLCACPYVNLESILIIN